MKRGESTGVGASVDTHTHTSTWEMAAARLRAEETVMAMLSEDEFGRADVVTSLATLPSVYARGGGLGGGDSTYGLGLSGPGLMCSVAETAEALARQRAAVRSLGTWKQRDKIKTVSVGLIACLNIGTDPPDSGRVAPYACDECWINPSSMPSAKALDAIGDALHKQYERWHPRAKYKVLLDPTIEDVKKLTASLRKTAKDERVLIHYNGHGVPRPTSNAEIWVFNANFSQYIPVSVADLITWTGCPAVFVVDCNNAGLLMNAFHSAATGLPRGPSGSDLAAAGNPAGGRRGSGGAVAAAAASMHAAVAQGETPPRNRDLIVLLACAATESLPTHPELPADVFTACLTTPIKMALHWFLLRRPDVLPPMFREFAYHIPGRIVDRRSPLGELNWVFTSITDTIAWTTLPRPLFLRLFRQDLLCASLFRNYLLADRVMRHYGCVPQSYPPLPPTHEHPLWATWDATVEALLSQLPVLLGFSAYDVQRMARLGLRPDLAHLDGEWSELLPPKEETPAAAAPAPAPGAAPPPPPTSARGAGAAAAGAAAPPPAPPRLLNTSTAPDTAATTATTASRAHGRRTSGSQRRESVGTQGGPSPAAVPAAVSAGLVPFSSLDFDGPSVDPVRLPLPAAANASGQQRVRLLRRFLARLMPSTSVGPAPTSAQLGLASYQPSSFFDEQMASFEVWLREAAYLPLRRAAHMAPPCIEFVQAASLGATSVGAGQMALQRGAAQLVALPVTLVLPAAPAPAKTVAAPQSRAGASRAGASGPAALSAEQLATTTGATTLVPVLRIQAPAQLPVILQVLLSQSQRLRALQLLARFVDLGHEAVNLTLMVGIHPYASKLLSNPSADLAPTLVFVWAKILAVDRDSVGLLLTQSFHTFFVDYLEKMATRHERLAKLRAARAGTSDVLPRANGQSRTKDNTPSVKRAMSPLARLLGIGASGASPGQDAASTAGTTTTAAATGQPGSTSDSGSAALVPQDQTVMALFVLCRLMEDNPGGRRALTSPRVLQLLQRFMQDAEHASARQWAAIVLAHLLKSNGEGRAAILMQRCLASAADGYVGASALGGDGVHREASVESVGRSVLHAARSSRMLAEGPERAESQPARSRRPEPDRTAATHPHRVRASSSDSATLRLPASAAAASPAPTVDTCLRAMNDTNPVVRCAAASAVASLFKDIDSVESSVDTTAAPSLLVGLSSFLADPAGGAGGDAALARYAADYFATRRQAHARPPANVVVGSGPADGVVPGNAVAEDSTTRSAADLGRSAARPRDAPSDAASELMTAADLAALAHEELCRENSSHSYLRAAWAVSRANYLAHGRFPVVWRQRPDGGRFHDATRVRRRRILLHILSNRIRRMLIPPRAVVDASFPDALHFAQGGPIVGGRTSTISGGSLASGQGTPFGIRGTTVAANDAARVGMPMPPMPGPATAPVDIAAASSNMPLPGTPVAAPHVPGALPTPGGAHSIIPSSPMAWPATSSHHESYAPASSMLRVVPPAPPHNFGTSGPTGSAIPVVIPVQTAQGIVQTTMTVPTSLLTPRVAMPLQDAGVQSIINEAPPADFLAEALAAAAAAERGKDATRGGMVPKGSAASLPQSSSTGAFPSSGAFGDRINSQDSLVSATTGALSPSLRAGRRLPGSTPGVEGAGAHGSSGAFPLSPARAVDKGSKASLLSSGEGAQDAAADGDASRGPSAVGGDLPTGEPRAAAAQATNGTRGSVAPDGPGEPPAAMPSTPSRDALADKRARYQARVTARARLQTLAGQLPDVADACGQHTRELCIAACVTPYLCDAAVAMRIEALLALARFAAQPAHEAGLCVSAAVTLMDFLTGGNCLLAALRCGTDDAAAPANVLATTHTDETSAPKAVTGAARVAAATAAAARAAAGSARESRKNQQLRIGFLQRLGRMTGLSAPTPPKPEAPPPPPVDTRESTLGPAGGVRRDVSMLGLPPELLPVHALAGCLHFFTFIFQHLSSRNGGRGADACARTAVDGALGAEVTVDRSGVLPAPSDSEGTAPARRKLEEDAAFSWMLRDAAGAPDPVLHSVVREMGPQGILYVGVWLALISATTDGSEAVAVVAANIVKRLLLRVVGFAGLELAGLLPRLKTKASMTGTADTALHSPSMSPARPTLHRQMSELSFEQAALDLWSRFDVPSLANLHLRSYVYERSAAFLYRPMLEPNVMPEEKDPMSATALTRVTRHRLVQSALSEAVTLGAAAYDDVSVKCLIEAAAALWTAMRGYSGASITRILQGNLTLARQAMQAIAAQHMSLLAMGSPEVVSPADAHGLVAQDSFANIAETYSATFPLRSPAGEPITAEEAAAADTAQLPSGLFYVGGTDTTPVPPMGGGTPSAVSPVPLPAHAQLGIASGPASAAAQQAVRAVRRASRPVASGTGVELLALQGAVSRHGSQYLAVDGGGARSPAVAVLAASSVAPSSIGQLATMPSSASSYVPPMELLPPPRSRNVSAPQPSSALHGPAGSPAVAPLRSSRRSSTRLTSAAAAAPALAAPPLIRRSSRVQSEYDGAEGHDARVSAALLKNDASLLSSSMGTPIQVPGAIEGAGAADLSLRVADVNGMDTARTRQSSLTESVAGAAIGVATGSAAPPGTLSTIHETAGDSGVPRRGPTTSRASSDGLSAISSNGVEATADAISQADVARPASMEASAVVPPAGAYFVDPALVALPQPVHEDELDGQLRAVASITPRLPPVMLARAQAGTVRLARSAARKMVQKALIDTGSIATTGLMFHPWADFVVVADQADVVTTWSIQDGAPVSRFSNSTGFGGARQGSTPLWGPTWTTLVRKSMMATPSASTFGSSGPDVTPLALGPRALGSRLASPLGDGRPGGSRFGGAPGLGTSGHGFDTDGTESVRSASVETPRHAHPATTALQRQRARRRVTAMTWINEHDTCHLVTAADDGVIRVWDGAALTASLSAAVLARTTSELREAAGPRAQSRASRDARSASMSTMSAPAPGAEAGSAAAVNAPPLVASFAALPELHTFPSVNSGDATADASAGMLCQWFASRCSIAVGGGRCPYVRIWDLQREQCVALHGLHAGSGVAAGADGHVPYAGHATSLTTAWPGTDLLVVGTSNGSIQVLDLRMGSGLTRATGSVVMSMHEHKKWVVSVAQARSGSAYAMVSGSVAADVRFWDLRRPSSVHHMVAHKAAMTALAVHDFAPLIATGTRRQQVNIFTNSGEPMSELRYHDGFAGQRFGPVSVVSFHPHRLYMGVGALDNIVGIYSGIPSRTDLGFTGI